MTAAMRPPTDHYQYALLTPGQPWPEELDSEWTFGIEVTDEALAAECVLGNLDPQHRGNEPQTAAITAAVTHPLPPVGCWLVTIRPDADALGAMAVFERRAQGGALTAAVHQRLTEVAVADAHSRGAWPGPHRAAGDSPPTDREVVTQLVMRESSWPLAGRVQMLRAWLAHGTLPADAEVRRRAIAAESAGAEASTRVRLTADGAIAVVTSRHRLALSIGYRCAPVVVADNPDFVHRGDREANPTARSPLPNTNPVGSTWTVSAAN
jgi:hypothetical protein